METEKKLNFFQRIFVAIFKLEDYGIFLFEKLSNAIKYFLLLILLMTIVLGIVNGYKSYLMITKAYDYIYNELPDFKFENGTLAFDKEVDAFDHDYNFAFVVNTNYNLDDKDSATYINKLSKGEQGICLLKDGFTYRFSDTESTDPNVISMKYSDISKEYEEVLSSKETLTKYLDMYPIRNMVMTIVVLNIFMGYFANVLSILLDIVIISMIGFIVSRFAKVLLNYRSVFILAVYSMTLPIFVTLIYAIINTLTGFRIMYFNLMYELIGCVYIVAAIYMIKFDLIKQNEELEKIIMVENQIRKEKEEEENRKAEEELKRREEQKKKEKEKKENKEDEIDAGEPDGSEI